MMDGPTSEIGVRKAGADERGAVKATLAAAFRDEALFAYIHPHTERRAERVHSFFHVLVDALTHHDDTWSAGSATEGVALWVPIGYGQPLALDEPAFDAALRDAAGPDADRLSEVIKLMGDQHPKEPHAYLWFLGVVPGAQKRGVGNALMSEVLKDVDRARRPAYLEATSTRSKKLYERHGFVARPHFEVGDGTKVWPMWRGARTVA